MKNINPNRIKFYQFLNDDLSLESFEKWIYENKELENTIPEDHYNDLLAFNFKSREVKKYIKSVVKKHFDWREYEKWRTVELLKKIKSGKVEIVLATRKLRKLYLEQELEIKRPFLSIGLAIGYESELDNCPIESEYNQWNSDALKKQLEPVEWYRKQILEDVDSELNELLKPELKTIDLGHIENIKHLHDTFAERLYFPEFYGNNWDAFWDSITGIVEMPNVLTLTNWDKFENTFEKESKILKEIIADYNNQNAEKLIKTVGNNGYKT
ncbi:barstar family protein [Marivirga arenosa]|uniref:Barstar family protein n=1 Tax=Marivirga arenosa TaxID=3059076 RepID=A0AA49GFA6_9BACT|nr:barstar family protein [Marivirga sp. ABR2-2]WKK83579.2 barstar family protein [Marivirga sp. ABR2-2]